jgi:transposase-like protein
LGSLLGEHAKGLSANTVSRLKSQSLDEHQTWQRQDLRRKDAYKAFDNALQLFTPKYPKAMACLSKDREELLAFYDFPAEHWIHIRTTNPIESAFATVRLRTKKSRNCGSRDSTLAMVFKLMESA